MFLFSQIGRSTLPHGKSLLPFAPMQPGKELLKPDKWQIGFISSRMCERSSKNCLIGSERVCPGKMRKQRTGPCLLFPPCSRTLPKRSLQLASKAEGKRLLKEKMSLPPAQHSARMNDD